MVMGALSTRAVRVTIGVAGAVLVGMVLVVTTHVGSQEDDEEDGAVEFVQGEAPGDEFEPGAISDRLTASVDVRVEGGEEAAGAVLEWSVARGDWDDLVGSLNLQLWMLIQLPLERAVGYYANQYPVLFALQGREGTYQFPYGIAVDTEALAGVCLIASPPRGAFGTNRAWICENPEWAEVEEEWGPRFEETLSFEMSYDVDTLPFRVY